MKSIHRLWDMVGLLAFCAVASVGFCQFFYVVVERRFGKKRPFIVDQWGNREPALEENERLWWPAKYYAIAAGIGAAIGVVLWIVSFFGPDYRPQ